MRDEEIAQVRQGHSRTSSRLQGKFCHPTCSTDNSSICSCSIPFRRLSSRVVVLPPFMLLACIGSLEVLTTVPALQSWFGCSGLAILGKKLWMAGFHMPLEIPFLVPPVELGHTCPTEKRLPGFVPLGCAQTTLAGTLFNACFLAFKKEVRVDWDRGSIVRGEITTRGLYLSLWYGRAVIHGVRVVHVEMSLGILVTRAMRSYIVRY